MTSFEELLRETTCTLEPLAMNYLFKIRDEKFPVIEQQSMPSTSDAYAKFVASYLTKENSEDDTLERDELVELKKCGEEVKTAHTRLETCRGALETLKDRYEVVSEYFSCRSRGGEHELSARRVRSADGRSDSVGGGC
uniref:Uncharacterized protein n=1 Tax=Plectus sambesii TaxID=2011161 RepID=A0A914UN87_9BILA